MATGTREIDVLSPYHLVGEVNAILLSGGSAFGLAAAHGVAEWLAEQGEGFDAGIAKVPIVPAAVIFDLAPGVGRPGSAEGRAASAGASTAPVREGRVGAGSGATVGKLRGVENATAGGIGSTSRAWGGGTVGVLAVVNALGDVLDEDGAILAGVRGPDGAFLRSDSLALEEEKVDPALPGTNTTLVVVATDLSLSRLDLGRLARMTSSAFPRVISPVNTPFDGDLSFALSTGQPEKPLPPQELLALGVLARELTEEAVRRAVTFRS